MTYSYGTTPDAVILSAMGGEDYPMQLVGDDIAAVVAAVNQGIDAHLTAITSSTFDLRPDRFSGRRLHCRVSPPDMVVLLRRLGDSPDDAAMSLRSAILDTLEIEEV